jgi:hypothetical protein
MVWELHIIIGNNEITPSLNLARPVLLSCRLTGHSSGETNAFCFLQIGDLAIVLFALECTVYTRVYPGSNQH